MGLLLLLFCTPSADWRKLLGRLLDPVPQLIPDMCISVRLARCKGRRVHVVKYIKVGGVQRLADLGLNWRRKLLLFQRLYSRA